MALNNQSDKIQQHQIPRCYLKRFTKEGSDSQIWVYDFRNEIDYFSNINKVARERHLYTIEEKDGTLSSKLEDMISKIESRADPLIQRFTERRDLSKEERRDIGVYLALMFIRTDYFRRHFAQFTLNRIQLKNYATALKVKSFDNHMNDFEQHKGRQLSKKERGDLKDFMLDPSHFEMSFDKRFTLMVMPLLKDLAPAFSDMNWCLIQAPTNQYFITSDNPVTKIVPRRHQGPMAGDSFLHPHIEVTMPLSPQHCWLGSWQEQLPSSFIARHEDVRELNRIRAACAERILLGPKRDSSIKTLGKKYRDRESELRSNGFGPSTYSRATLRRR